MSEASGDNAISSPQRDDQITPPAGDRLPLSVRVVAWFFVVTGVLSLVNMAVQKFFTNGFAPNYGWAVGYCILCISAGLAHRYYVLGLLVGPALLCRRSTWLQIARVYNVFLMIMLAFGLTTWFVRIFLVYRSSSGPGLGVGDVLSDYALLVASLAAVLVYLVWQQRVLGRRGVRELFQSADAAPRQPAKRFQFSLATLLMLAALVATLLPRLMQVDVVRHRVTSGSYSSGSPRSQISVACRSHRLLPIPDELEYVLFVRDSRQTTGRLDDEYSLTGEYTSADVWAILEMPDGSRATLPADCQIFECIDGRFRGSPGRVTKAQFDAFRASNPAEYTIDALLEFAEAHPE